MWQEFEDDSWNDIMIPIILTNINYTSNITFIFAIGL